MSALPRADLLLQLIDEVRGLRAEVRAALEEWKAKGSNATSGRNAATEEALLRAIAKYAPDRAFSNAELVVHAGKVPELRAAIVAAVGALNARKLGRALRRVEGVNLGGLAVGRIGDDGAGLVWFIKRVSEA